ncbi:hypothetical protein HOA55_04885 [archaeon]|jgi:hypothetical protein|nr:hypothetical protein [archaeon]MBT3578115.1 hypothetical protein [archaeon]MBT6820663.1 hypothetical protein [archaeon]MBT6955692.1 hypothetical protein [archaeon]MBT7024927.1 hypothetical protein [archaeon]
MDKDWNAGDSAERLLKTLARGCEKNPVFTSDKMEDIARSSGAGHSLLAQYLSPNEENPIPYLGLGIPDSINRVDPYGFKLVGDRKVFDFSHCSELELVRLVTPNHAIFEGYLERVRIWNALDKSVEFHPDEVEAREYLMGRFGVPRNDVRMIR